MLFLLEAMHTNDTDVIATGIQHWSVKQVGDVWSAAQLHTIPNPSVEITIEHTVSSDIPIILSATAGSFFPRHPFRHGTEVGLHLLCKQV